MIAPNPNPDNSLSPGRSRRAPRHGAAGARPPAPVPPARSEIIAIQRAIVERLKREIDASIGPVPPAVQLYYEEYWKEIADFEAVSSKHELLDACEAAEIVYVGDYHTLRQSQETAAKLLDELLLRGREVVLALEMVPSDRQDVLERYVAREIDDLEFLRAIDYARVWDFQWEPYRKLLGLARCEGVSVVGINSEPADPRTRVIERDFNAARVIVRETLARPGATILVLDGDLHVARDHLPLIVDSELRKAGATRRRAVVHQNADAIWWKLAERGLEREVDVVRIAEGCFCVFSATPLVKLQSYVNWEQNHDELCVAPHPEWRRGGGGEADADHVERMHEMVRTIAGFLELPPEGLDDFSLYTLDDLDFLEILRRDPRFGKAELAAIERQVREAESTFVPKANIIYLADLTVHRAAEEATHFIHAVRSGLAMGRRGARDAFYVEALTEALGFFGSRVIDPGRTCLSFEDLAEVADAGDDGGAAEGRKSARRFRKIARLSLAHREAERRWLGGRRFLPPRGILARDRRVVSGVAHTLGYILGDKLHNALVQGCVGKALVRELFTDPLKPGAAERRYLALVERLEGVGHGVPLESQRF